VPISSLAPVIEALLGEIQAELFDTAKRMLAEHTADVDRYEELALRVAANAGWSLAHWCGDAACEARVKAETKATIRCIPRDLPPESGRCIVCGETSGRRVVFARAY
jgi:prolyl-tRNA synthetase